MPGIRPFRVLAAGFLLFAVAGTVVAQPTGPGQGRAAEAWHWIQKLQTTGSVLEITAHPDDENGALLALLSRGHGVRTALLSLTRGEAGANAIGPELFDGLGLIRAAELEASANWYGLDRIYYTPLVDYGYSKNLEEALRSWDEEAAAADVVEVIRRERPMVVLARFTGDPRDGHGQHQFAGRIAVRGFDGAPDMGAFPAREGRRPHLPLAFFHRARDEEGALELDIAGSRPWLSHSFAELNAIGLSYQRSQTRGVVRPVAGRGTTRLLRADGDPADHDLLAMLGPERASLSARFGPVVPGRLMAVLESLDAHFAAVAAGFDWRAPEASLPRLGEALAEARELLSERSPSGFFDVRHELERKEEQLVAAIRAAAGVSFDALASEPAAESGGSPFAPPPAFGPAVPGQRFEVRVSAAALTPARVARVALDVPGEVEPVDAEGGRRRFVVTLAPDAPVLQPHVERSGLGDSRYRANGDWTLGAPPPALTATVDLEIPAGDGRETVTVPLAAPVERFEPNLPYGYERRELEILPPVSVAFDPGFAAFPSGTDTAFEANLTVTGNQAGEFRVGLELPDGFRAEPAASTVAFDRAGEEAGVRFTVHADGVAAGGYEITATVDGGSGDPAAAIGYQRIAHRDLPLRYLVRPASLRVAGVELAMPEGLRVGYVTGAGDEVPAGIEALGAEVTLLDETALLNAELSGYDAVVTGTRAYAVRPDLLRANRRLLDYARGGGHLVVLYNTDELIPSQHAPYPGVLPRRSEEVSEEDSPLTVLAPDHPLMTWPHRIGPADFEGWVEQRGSKFWSAWDDAYTALFETQDTGQDPQRGGALSAEVGEGRYTYFAYALHRQLPEGVPGAFRLLGNLIAASRSPQ
ncbi:MAG: PIG-L family deacetylase [Acidobacteriota bacterium]|nr:PIG-L family deacetylase [Acidobacteriota bacterium]